MNNAASDGGGGGGVTSYVVDHATLTTVCARMGTAGTDLDAVGSTMPSAGGTGEAEPLLLMMMAAAAEAAARMSVDATTLAAAVEDCNVTARTVDSDSAASFLVDGAPLA